MAITSANQLELLQTAEAVAREKMIDPDLVIQAMEDSLARAAKSRYGSEMDIRVKIDRKTGRASFTRVRTVVEDDAVENYQAQLTVAQAKQYLADPQIGDEIVDEVPPVDLGRIAAQSAKQVILQKVREAERDRQFEEFKDRKGTIINGVVKREEYGNIIVDIGRGDRSWFKPEPREQFSPARAGRSKDKAGCGQFRRRLLRAGALGRVLPRTTATGHETIGDACLGQIIRCQFAQHLVTYEYADAVFAHAAGRVGNDLVLVFQFHTEHRVGQQFGHHARKFQYFFLRHSIPFQEKIRRRAGICAEPIR